MKTSIFNKTKLCKEDKDYLRDLSEKHGLAINKKTMFVSLYKNYSRTFIMNKLGSYFYDPDKSHDVTYYFLKGTKASDLVSLFTLEKFLSSAFLDMSLDIEKRFKASLVDSFIEHANEYNVPFNPQNMSSSLQGRDLESLYEELYHKDYRDITPEDKATPIRLLVFNMTFGGAMHLYNNLNDELKQIVIGKWPMFENQTLNLSNVILMVKDLRNCLAHGDLLIGFTHEMNRYIQAQIKMTSPDGTNVFHLYPIIYAIDYYFYHEHKNAGVKMLWAIFNHFSFSAPAQACLDKLIDFPVKSKR